MELATREQTEGTGVFFENVALADGKQMSSTVCIEGGILVDSDEESEVRLFALDDNKAAVKEVLPDGNGTEVILEGNQEEPGGTTENPGPQISPLHGNPAIQNMQR